MTMFVHEWTIHLNRVHIVVCDIYTSRTRHAIISYIAFTSTFNVQTCRWTFLYRVWDQDEHILWLLPQFTINLLEIGVMANTYWDITIRRNRLWKRGLCRLLFNVMLAYKVGLSDCRGKKGTTFRILKVYKKDLHLDNRWCLPKFRI